MLNVGGEKVARILPNRLITTHSGRGGKVLYLSFDDGPNEKYTLPLCELLAKYSAKATFFCVGKQILKYPEIASYLVGQGHMIANHSQNHRSFRKLSLQEQIAEVEDCDDSIRAIDPEFKRVFRAPQGHLSIPLLFKLKARGWQIVHWSYDSKDYLQLSVKEQLAIIESKSVVDGDILLFHDDNQLAIDVLAEMLPFWKSEGFKFHSIRELVS